MGLSADSKSLQRAAKRWMEEQDYAAYLAVRAIGEAATRTKSNDVKQLKDFMLSDQFCPARL